MTSPDLFKRVVELKSQRKLLLEYTQIKIKEDDLHGAIDSLMDCRDIDAEIKGLYYCAELRDSDPPLKGNGEYEFKAS